MASAKAARQQVDLETLQRLGIRSVSLTERLRPVARSARNTGGMAKVTGPRWHPRDCLAHQDRYQAALKSPCWLPAHHKGHRGSPKLLPEAYGEVATGSAGRFRVARPAGLEPATGGLEVHCSIQLSYERQRYRLSLLTVRELLLPFRDLRERRCQRSAAG